MESSKTHERTINLGKQLVAALERDHSSKPVTHWMAHYIAELMVKAESTTGAEQEAAKSKCFESILMLWKHRAALPDGVRPFEAFESVLETLHRLNPNNDKGWFARFRSSPDSCDTETKKLLKIMESVDESARCILRVLLDVAVSSNLDKETTEYLRNAKGELSDKRIEALVCLLDSRSSFGEDKLDDAKRRLIKERIEHLDRVLASAKLVKKLLSDGLQKEEITQGESIEGEVQEVADTSCMPTNY